MGPGLLFMALVALAYLYFMMGRGVMVGGFILAAMVLLFVSGVAKCSFLT